MPTKTKPTRVPLPQAVKEINEKGLNKGYILIRFAYPEYGGGWGAGSTPEEARANAEEAGYSKRYRGEIWTGGSNGDVTAQKLFDL